jgi:hypothetical protein
MNTGAAVESVVNLASMSSPEMQRIFSPGTAATASARGMAKIAAALANYRELDEVRLLQAATMEKFLRINQPTFEHVFGLNYPSARLGGYGLRDRGIELPGEKTTKKTMVFISHLQKAKTNSIGAFQT